MDHNTFNTVSGFDAQKYYQRKIEPMIGVDSFKELMKEIIDIEPRIQQDNTYDIFLHQYYLFSMEDGSYIEDYLQIMRDVVSLKGMMTITSDSNAEYIRVPILKEKSDLYQSACSFLDRLFRKGTNVVCLDITNWLSELQNPDFRKLLLFLEDYYDSAIIVFRIPYLDPEIVNKVYNTLSDVLTVRRVMFPPLSLDRLIEYGKAKLKKYRFTAQDDVWDLFRKRIIQEKNEGKFYEKMTIDKLVREMVYTKQRSDVYNGSNDCDIKPQDLDGFVSSDFNSGSTAEEMINQLVGLDEIKKQIKEIAKTISYIKKNKKLESPCIHMRFAGNPGTGKTTVARIIGKLLKEKGVLSKGDFFEVTGRDLCGSYIGHTAPLTERICRDAYGSVLFIDEAYSLYTKDGSDRDFGREALVTLIGEMENHRNDFVVIMAGYSDEMKDLMDGNPGLISRMPFLMEFPNYTKEELTDIFFSMIPDTIRCSDEFKKSVTDYFLSISDGDLTQKEFSNARFVRNLFELTLSKAIVRHDEGDFEELCLLPQDFELACSSKSITQLMERKQTRVGFGFQ